MSDTKIRNWQRDRIRRAALDKRFEAEEKHLDALEDLLATAVFHDVLGPEEKLIETLPDGWLPMASSICVRFGPDVARLNFDEEGPTPHKLTDGVCAVYDVTHEFSEQWEDIRHAREDIKELRARLSAQISAVLASCSTFPQLMKRWPEVREFAEACASLGPDNVVSLPAINISTLNEALGLSPAA